MVPLSAEILTEYSRADGRGAVRRTLRLGVQAHSVGDVAMAIILNLSETGLLLETVVRLEVGETLLLDIPEAPRSAVRIVWTDGFLAGCEFFSPVSGGTVSAVQLKAEAGSAYGNRQSAAPERRYRVDDDHRDEKTFEKTIVSISALISVVALIIFLAAILPL